MMANRRNLRRECRDMPRPTKRTNEKKLQSTIRLTQWASTRRTNRIFFKSIRFFGPNHLHHSHWTAFLIAFLSSSNAMEGRSQATPERRRRIGEWMHCTDAECVCARWELHFGAVFVKEARFGILPVPTEFRKQPKIAKTQKLYSTQRRCFILSNAKFLSQFLFHFSCLPNEQMF